MLRRRRTRSSSEETNISLKVEGKVTSQSRSEGSLEPKQMKCKMIVKAAVLVTVKKIPPAACCTASTAHLRVL